MEYLNKVAAAVRNTIPDVELYAVGGCVRDAIMGNTPKDFDFCSPDDVDKIEDSIKNAGRRVYAIGKKFGTVGFKVEVDGKYELVEITQFRSEVYTSKSRKPEVEFVSSLDEDLARRDFTMNAMVLKSDGKIYDPYGGKLDIHTKLIKTVGMPKDRIQEDPLRMLRAARFAARYDFNIDPNFIGKSRQLADRIFDVSIERWIQELDKILTSNTPYWGIEILHDMAILPRVLPELYSDTSYTNPFDCHENGKRYEDADIAWKFLLSHVNLPDKIKDGKRTIRYVNSGICQRLKFSNDRTNLIIGNKKS